MDVHSSTLCTGKVKAAVLREVATDVVVVEEHHPEVAAHGGDVRAGGGIVFWYPGTDFVEVDFLVVAVNQAYGEAMGGAVDGVVGAHVACGALPLVGDREVDGVVGDEAGADVGGVRDGGIVGDEAELHLCGVPIEGGTIDVEGKGVGYLVQPGGSDGGAAACGGTSAKECMEIAALDDGLVVDAAFAEVPAVDVAVAGLTVGVPFLIEQHEAVVLSRKRGNPRE